MMAGVIFVFSAAALLQFFISYCRSLIAASSKQVLSAEVKDVTGIQRFASGDDFKRVIGSIHDQSAPGWGEVHKVRMWHVHGFAVSHMNAKRQEGSRFEKLTNFATSHATKVSDIQIGSNAL